MLIISISTLVEPYSIIHLDFCSPLFANRYTEANPGLLKVRIQFISDFSKDVPYTKWTTLLNWLASSVPCILPLIHSIFLKRQLIIGNYLVLWWIQRYGVWKCQKVWRTHKETIYGGGNNWDKCHISYLVDIGEILPILAIDLTQLQKCTCHDNMIESALEY